MDFKNILVTGGAGFIGSNFIRLILHQKEFNGIIINVDKLTYAGNILNLKDIEEFFGGKRYFFEYADICDYDKIKEIFKKYQIDAVVHFAAESHVDRSIYGPKDFIQTNILGTFTLLECARLYWNKTENKRFHHISTDEVYGSLGPKGYFYETSPYIPASPYSASKASADHLVRAYYYTYNLPVTLSNCSNNYGPYQFPEKLIPLTILNIIEEKPLPVYGDGKNIRDWIYVDDHNRAIISILEKGKIGQTYNIGGENEWKNIRLVNKICEIIAKETGKDKDYYKKLITFIKDRPGHDRRYAINCDKIKKDIGWEPLISFEEGLKQTIKWYLNNMDWIKTITTGKYKEWIDKNYRRR